MAEQEMVIGESSSGKICAQRIICPLCPNVQGFSLHRLLLKHLTDFHEIKITRSSQLFSNFEEFTVWRNLGNREVDYACQNTRKDKKGEKIILYNCNRSDTKGYINNYKARNNKIGGSIKIRGVCPSRIEARILINGQVSTDYIETHIGHEDELRTKRLKKTEELQIVEKLKEGVPNNRILQDARKITHDNLTRINILTPQDLINIRLKHNIDNRRHKDDMVATSLKIREWNQQGKNQAFLFKNIGDSYPGLLDEDFAVGFMNGVMEKKLREHGSIICIDGTHGTNQRNWELTIVLVKGETNNGFPVAFFLSNRKDQMIQEIFFTAFKSRLGRSIEADFLMSDDDPKYYNAWIKVMKPQKPLRRLLCSWHIVKNWNIQGRRKLQDPTMRKEMKMELRKIHQELDETKFESLVSNYLKRLEDNHENDFLSYLKTFYFQNKERTMMWAYCYRKGVGINTNMAIESLNKYLKYNKMEGKKNIRVEKLLDLFDQIVDEKMWKQILLRERPNANNYYHRVTVEAHCKSLMMKENVENVGKNSFRVKSQYEDKFYNVSIITSCDEDCRMGYCAECKICLHQYKCDCASNSIKTILCKHIHAAFMFGRRSDSVSDEGSDEDAHTSLHINEPTTSQMAYQDDVRYFIEETASKPESSTSFNCNDENPSDEELMKRIQLLDQENRKELNRWLIARTENQGEICKKRRIEKQSYYPRKK